jgi:hypothetical protein
MALVIPIVMLISHLVFQTDGDAHILRILDDPLRTFLENLQPFGNILHDGSIEEVRLIGCKKNQTKGILKYRRV